MKEENKAKRFNILIAATKKKTKLEEKKIELEAASEDTKMLTMRMDELDPNAAMIVHAVRVRMLKRLADEKEVDGEEAANEKETAAE